MLLNRIGALLISMNGRVKSPYTFVQKMMEALEPLDPIEDSNALRSLAKEIDKDPTAD